MMEQVRVRFPQDVEEQKQCPNGKPKFGKKDVLFDTYFRNYNIKGALDCPGNYVKWNPNTRKYCCDDIPATYDEMIQKTHDLLETIEEKGDSNGSKNAVLRWKDIFIDKKKGEFNVEVIKEGFTPLTKRPAFISTKAGSKKKRKRQRNKNTANKNNKRNKNTANKRNKRR